MLSPARDRIRRHEACLSEEGCAVEEREEEEKRRGETSTARGHVWVGVMGILSDEVEVAVSAGQLSMLACYEWTWLVCCHGTYHDGTALPPSSHPIL